MKKRLILLLTIFITFMGCSSAQQATSTQRLKFMGKSMDCSMSEMAAYLQTKGYKLETKQEGFIGMSGTFLGYRDCIFVLRENYNILSSCEVFTNYYDGILDMSWTKLESNYNYIVDKFTQKYGAPRISKSEFEGNPYSDYEKLNFVDDDKCRYYSVFLIEGGTISVSIISRGIGIISIRGVMIQYVDDIAKDKIDKIQQDEL